VLKTGRYNNYGMVRKLVTCRLFRKLLFDIW
jgi:hypothetical protein